MQWDKLVIATSNKGKLTELSPLLATHTQELIPQSALGITDAAETGTTFIENAIIKARHAACESGLPALADDSGLVVPALSGAPGILSARYAGEKANSADNITKLLSALKSVAPSERHAYFYCVIILLTSADDPTPIVCEGKWHGSILTQPQGHSGFGYDPVFYVAEQHCSAAELSLTLKNQISHRGQALAELLKKIKI